MRILVDARPVQDHFPGIGRYVFNLINALAPQVEGELLALVDVNATNTRFDLSQWQQYPNLELITTDIPIFHWRSQTRLPGLIQRLQPDVVHFTYNVRPLRVNTPSLLTLYDLIPRHYPQYFPLLTRWKIEGIQRAALRASTGFVSISHHTAQDFSKLYGIPKQRITITPLAADPRFRPHSQSELASFRRERGLPEQYYLYLGSNKPHKNLPRLIQAWKQVKAAIKDAKLIIAGHWDERYPQARELANKLGIADDVLFWGPVASDDLPLLYAAAQAFIFPSLYEGFGLPVLEAMASGIPVACSHAPGLTEVAGKAAVSFAPASVNDITRAITLLGTDSRARAHYARLGKQRAGEFSWDNTASLTIRAYRNLLG